MHKNYNVQPLRTEGEIQEMKDSLRRWCSERDRFLFVLGINTGLRVSDLVGLKVGDVQNTDFTILERKSKRKRHLKIKGRLSEEVKAYTKGMNNEDFLFQSRRKDGRGHISEVQAYRQLVHAGEMIGRRDIGTHSMRKTFGYHYYERTQDIATLMEIFSHASPAITKKYIGITQIALVLYYFVLLCCKC